MIAVIHHCGTLATHTISERLPASGFVIICGGSRTAHTARRYLAPGAERRTRTSTVYQPIGLANRSGSPPVHSASCPVWWPCTLRHAVASERSALKYGYTVYITCKALDSLAGAADKVSPVRLYMADNGPYSAGCTPQSVLLVPPAGVEPASTRL